MTIVGYEAQARTLLDQFSWGPSFFNVNSEILEIYKGCSSAEEVSAAQKEWLAALESSYEERKAGSQELWEAGNTNRGSYDTISDDESQPETANPEDQIKVDRLGNTILATEAL